MSTAALPAKQRSAGSNRIRAGTWVVDPGDSVVAFAIKHLGVVPVRGRFRGFEGTVELGERRGASRAYGRVAAASLDTGNEKRDHHLRSADFFDVDNHPELRFESARIEPVGARTFRIVGALAMHGVSRTVELVAEVVGNGDERRRLKVATTLSRREFAIRPSAGAINAVIADKVGLKLDLALVKRD
jgi:polyisoprenoid-binding protein YceI